MQLQMAEGWEEVSPHSEAPPLLVERAGRLWQIRSDFSEVNDFGPVGPVDCPSAYDPAARVAYRYVCESRLGRRDFSELRAFDLRTGDSETVLRMGLNRWVLWSLQWIGGGEGQPGRLFGLLASDLQAEDRVEIRHQLFALNPEEGLLRLRPVCRDAFYPLAFSLRRRELLFSGAEGIYIVGLKGERRASLVEADRPGGRGGDFDPSGRGRVVLGGAGLFLWDYEKGFCRRWAERGQLPVWSQDGRTIWFSESSSELLAFDTELGETTRLLGIRDNRSPERSFARAARPSPCGRYLAIPLTGRRLRGVQRDKLDPSRRDRVYETVHYFCILDLHLRHFWRLNEFISNFCWID